MLRSVRGFPSEERIHLATLRSMSQARYAAQLARPLRAPVPPLPPFHVADPTLCGSRGAPRSEALAARAKRDRAVEAATRGSRGEARASELERLAIWLSGRERVAIEAEREAAAFACCALLEGREGEGFEAEVTGVTEHGLFVRGSASRRRAGSFRCGTLDRAGDLDDEAEALEGSRAGAADRDRHPSRVRLALTSTAIAAGSPYALVDGLGAPAGGGPGARRCAQGAARASERDSHSR